MSGENVLSQICELDSSLTNQVDSVSSIKTDLLISIVMPCLDEALTVVRCIERSISAMSLMQSESSSQRGTPLAFEVIVADNGSRDDSKALAAAAGAIVVDVRARGYGAAITGGIAAAGGKYVVIADADDSYAFDDIPAFIRKLEEGFDLVVGNRFAGGIKPGAMPWHHRYVGTPMLSGLGRLLYNAPLWDWQCGLRGFDREKIVSLSLKCDGMEYASEMILRASQEGFKIAEIPTTLYPDGRDRRPHLRSFRDGFKNLKLLLSSYKPQTSCRN